MAKLLSMILTACDPRMNPAARLVSCQASQAFGSLVQLLRTACASAATADNYTKKDENMFSYFSMQSDYKAISAFGRVVSA